MEHRHEPPRDRQEDARDPVDDEVARALDEAAERLLRASSERPVRRFIAKIAASGGAFLLGTAPLRVLGLVSEPVVCRLTALVMVVFGLLWAGRNEIHLESGYVTWNPRRRPTPTHPRRGSRKLHRWLCASFCVDIVIAFLCVDLGVHFLMRPANASACISACALGFAMLINSLGTGWLIKQLDLKRGSETVGLCWLTRILRGAAGMLDIRVVEWLDSLWDKKTAPEKVSKLVLWTLGAMCTVALANGPAVAPTVYGWLSGPASTAPRHRHKKTAHKPARDGQTNQIARRAHAIARRGDAIPELLPLTQVKPDYSDLCGPVKPGWDAPPTQAQGLYDQWLGENGLGGILAGCATRAHQVGASGLWYAAGMCHAELRSLAVADLSPPSAILLWAPARFALDAARAGSLLDVTPHKLVARGDLYVVSTTNGTYAFARRAVSDGAVAQLANARSCADVKPDPVPFVKVPPPLTRLWASEMAAEGRWLWPISADGVHFSFRSLDVAQTRRARAVCTTEFDCRISTGDGRSSRSVGAPSVAPAELLEWAPAESP